MTTKIVHSIDWLQYSIEWPQSLTEWPLDLLQQTALARTAIPHLADTLMPDEVMEQNSIAGMQGYTHHYNLGYASAHVHPLHREMKIGVRMTGDNIRAFRDMGGGTDARLIEFMHFGKAKPSRIDIAFDLFNFGIDPLRIYRDWKAGKVQCRARTVKPLTTGTKGQDGVVQEASTVYFGSRQSEVMVRVYEKGKQLGVDLDWVRLEIELKGDKAAAHLQNMYAYGFEQVGKQILREYFTDVPYAFFKLLTEGQSVQLQAVGRKLTAHEAWVMDVIIPMLQKDIEHEWSGCVENGITGAVEALVRTVWTDRARKYKEQYGV